MMIVLEGYDTHALELGYSFLMNIQALDSIAML